MRILSMVGGGDGTRVTGPEIRGWALVHALAERHDVTVAVHDTSRSERDGHRLVPFTRKALVHEARRHDVVIAPTVPPYLFAALRGMPTVTVSDQYDPVHLELSALTSQPGIERVLRSQRLVREVQLRFADVIACAGERQRELALDELASIGGRPGDPATVVSVPFGLPDAPPPSASHPIRDRFPQIGANDPLVLWWGKIWKWFDADTAIRAIELVARRRPDVRFVISAGKAPKARFDWSETTEDARALAAELGLLDRNVFFLDEWTPYDRRHEYLQDADIGLTLHADTVEAPFAARARYLDYLWCALPCVLARGDETAGRFGAAGFARIVAPGAPAATADAILALIDDPSARRTARDAGRNLADEFRWTSLVRPLTDAIERRAAVARRSHQPRLVRSVGRYYWQRGMDHAVAMARTAPRPAIRP